MQDIDRPSKVKSSNHSLSVIGIVLLILLLLGGVFYGTYQWQHDMVTNLNREVTRLNTQLGDAQKQVSNVQNKDESTYVSAKGITVKVYTPLKNANVNSPLAVLGEVPGSWSFEASFPVVLKDSNGTIIAQVPAQVLGDWMTDKLVPFSVQLTYDAVPSGDGVLILQKDNPSGLSKNDDSVTIPIKFE